ncbi:MAG TPA: glycosyl hydrolase [Opitutus sp.]|nr:glycosyl hydrolase [Opitutus sp.]
MNPLSLACRAALFCLLLPAASLFAATAPAEPVSPNASPEARALLQLLYDLTGKHTLTGQHNYPNIKDRNTQFATRYIGKTPAVFSTDWGFAKPDDTDSYLARPDIVQECIRQHQLGSIITICWHAVPPTADEPVTFRPPADTDPKALKSVQGKLLDEQFREVLTPGTALHTKWTAQVDAIAVHLKALEAAKVPILWRPYHEMNGDWFWWGGRTGEYSTERLYRQIFDRLVNHHKLTNLVWVWSVDRVSRPGMEHEKYFPGIQYMDVLGLDVYGNDFAQSYYESLEKLSQGKPLALAEVGNPPALEILAKQPKWTFYATWAGMVRNTRKKDYTALMADPRILNLDDPRYAEVVAPYRESCGLPPLSTAPRPVDFSGSWVLNEELSQLGRQGAGFAPARLEVTQANDELTIETTRILEYAPDDVSTERLRLDGSEVKSQFMNAPRTTTARRSPEGDALLIESQVAFRWLPAGTTALVKDTWKLSPDREQLTIHRSSVSPRGPQETTMVFQRR